MRKNENGKGNGKYAVFTHDTPWIIPIISVIYD